MWRQDSGGNGTRELPARQITGTRSSRSSIARNNGRCERCNKHDMDRPTISIIFRFGRARRSDLGDRRLSGLPHLYLHGRSPTILRRRGGTWAVPRIAARCERCSMPADVESKARRCAGVPCRDNVAMIYPLVGTPEGPCGLGWDRMVSDVPGVVRRDHGRHDLPPGTEDISRYGTRHTIRIEGILVGHVARRMLVVRALAERFD